MCPMDGGQPERRRTVLFVDDDDSMRRAVRRLLTATDWDVLEAPDALAGLEIAVATKAIDVLLADVVLPGMDGGELAKRVRALHPETRVLYTSGYGPSILAKHGITDGAGRFLAKPYTPETLLHRLEEALQAPNEAPR